MCFNGRNARLFPINVTENFCQAYAICSIEQILPMFSSRNSSLPECQLLRNKTACVDLCKDRLISLTDAPIMYPEVRFLYESIQNRLPDLICYDNSQCQLFPPSRNTSEWTCRKRPEFNFVNGTSFADFYSTARRLFSTCQLPVERNRSNYLFDCPNTHQSISLYRLNDGVNDCFRSDADENFDRICQIRLSDRFPCLTTKDCFLRENLYHDTLQRCSDASDRVYPFQCKYRTDFGCYHRRGGQVSMDYFIFQELCNGQLHPDVIDDETNCEPWQRLCNLKYRKCDGIVNCFDRKDEISCDSTRFCQPDELDFHCYRYPNRTASKTTCLPKRFINNGVVDCFASIDEDIGYCARHYPFNTTVRFHCYNDSKCIPLEDVCDGISDCPHKDDETICRRYTASLQCRPGMYLCGGVLQAPFCAPKRIRCDGQATCLDGDSRIDAVYNDEVFCNLVKKRIRYKRFPLVDHQQYPPEAIVIQAMFNQTNPVGQSRSKRSFTLDVYRCHRGIVIRSSIDGEQCLCPPSYYGDRCQYQSERISLVLYIEKVDENRFPMLVYKLLIRLQTSFNLSYSSMEVYYSTSFNRSAIHKQVIYLRAPPIYQSYAIVIDIFQVSRETVEYHSSLYYDIPFSFLPVNRFARKILIDDSQPSIDRCDLDCSTHGQCRIYANHKYRPFCLCDSGWFGEQCQFSQTSSCSSSALMFQFHCLCPLNYFGERCFAHVDVCRNPSACRNGGTCIPLDLRFLNWICLCPMGYYGVYCQHQSARIHITMKNLWIHDRSKLHIPLVIVHLANLTDEINLASVQRRDLFKNVPFDSELTSYVQQWTLPTFAFVQTYFEVDVPGDFYLVALLKSPIHLLTTGILPSNRCPRSDEFFDSSIMSMPYIQRLKHYYRPCVVLGTRCFYDEKYVCFCDTRAYLDCVRFNHSDQICATTDTPCLNGGHCYQPMQTSIQSSFTCVCPRCYFGDRCQFTLTKYAISLDAVLDQDIRVGRSFFAQNALVIGISFLVLFLVIVGSISNAFSILTFVQKQPRLIGCGYYLLVISIVNLLGIVVFGARFVYTLLTQIGSGSVFNLRYLSISCITLQLLLSILPSIADWLTACVSIERTLVAIYGLDFSRKKSVFYAKFVILGIVCLNILSALHEPFYHRVITDSQNGIERSWCVVKYSSRWLHQYVLFKNIIHLIVPFLIHCGSIIILLINLIRRKSVLTSGTNRKSPLEVLKSHMIQYRMVLLTPFILIILELPRLISSFAFSCLKFPWQRHLMLASYLVSSLPMALTLFLYVLPKVSYKIELIQSLTSICRFRLHRH